NQRTRKVGIQVGICADDLRPSAKYLRCVLVSGLLHEMVTKSHIPAPVIRRHGNSILIETGGLFMIAQAGLRHGQPPLNVGSPDFVWRLQAQSLFECLQGKVDAAATE